MRELATQELSPAAAARAVVGAAHTCELLAGAPALARDLVYVDDGGSPLQLVPCAAPRVLGPMTLRFRVWPLLGAVEMAVTADEPVTAERRRCALNGLLDSHSRCLERHEIPRPARLVALTVQAVRLRLEPEEEAAPLELEDYLLSRPCLFATFGPALMRHLTTTHQDQLTALVRTLGLSPDPLAAEAVALEPGRLHVRVIDVAGSRADTVDFPGPLGHPHALGGALQRLLHGDR
jgi:hypothetical protein